MLTPLRHLTRGFPPKLLDITDVSLLVLFLLFSV